MWVGTWRWSPTTTMREYVGSRRGSTSDDKNLWRQRVARVQMRQRTCSRCSEAIAAHAHGNLGAFVHKQQLELARSLPQILVQLPHCPGHNTERVVAEKRGCGGFGLGSRAGDNTVRANGVCTCVYTCNEAVAETGLMVGQPATKQRGYLPTRPLTLGIRQQLGKRDVARGPCS